jgi:DNA-binding beta-propeller fold protein YncE
MNQHHHSPGTTGQRGSPSAREEQSRGNSLAAYSARASIGARAGAGCMPAGVAARTTAAGLVAAVLLGGCASPPAMVYAPAKGGLVWPGPPDEPRVSYVGSLVSAGEAASEKKGLDALGEALFGREQASGMVNPMGVCTNGAERVFVVDSGLKALHVFDLDTQKCSTWRPAEGEAPLGHPVAAAFDAVNQRVLVSDASAGVVRVFGLDGQTQGELGRGALGRPCGLAVQAGTGNVFVADVKVHCVVVLSPDGSEIARLGSRGAGPGQMNFPTYVAFDPSGRLYVADTLNFRVLLFGADYQFIRQIGRKGDIPGYFSQPKGVATDPDGHVYVVDANFEAVQIFDGEGALLLAFGREGRGPGEFWLPSGVWIDGRGRALVADAYNRRIQIFQYLGKGGKP